MSSGDGRRPALGYDVAVIKGRERLGRRLSVCLPSARLSELIDLAHVHPSVRSWALEGFGLARSIASRCLLRVPLRASAARDLPPHLIADIDSVPYLQSLDPSGLPGTGEFMASLWDAGIDFSAVTSMNATGTPEIVDFGPAFEFAQQAALPALLVGPLYAQVRGSFSILALGPAGLSMTRVGTYSRAALQRSVPIPIGGLG